MAWDDLRFDKRKIGERNNPIKKNIHHPIKKTKFCPYCKKEKPYEKFSIDGKLDNYCLECKTQIKSKNLKICKSCKEFRNPKYFLKKGIQHEICTYCLEHIKCPKCGELKYRFEFFKNGKEQIYCNRCMKIRYSKNY